MAPPIEPVIIICGNGAGGDRMIRDVLDAFVDRDVWRWHPGGV
jgi:hypothetical protein